MKPLILFFCGDPSVKSAYQSCLARVGLPDARIVFCNVKGFSSAYANLARSHLNNNEILPSLFEHYGALDFDSVHLVSFSAGYAAIREILKHDKDVERIGAVILIDSIHSSLDPDGTAGDDLLSPFVRFAHLAQSNEKLLWVGHTDVKTPQKGPSAFASTTQSAIELSRLAGGNYGNYLTRSYNLKTDDFSEHVAALTAWGHLFVAEALGPYLLGSGTGGPPTLPDLHSFSTPSFIEATVEAAKRDVGIEEIPFGSNSGKRIDEMLRGQGLGPGNSYCAAALSDWINRGASMSGSVSPVHGSAGAKALMAQFAKVGRFVAIGKVRENLQLIREGACFFMDRSTPGKPETAYMGHCGLVISHGPGFRTIQANYQNGIAIVDENINDSRLLGLGYLD